jgi:hypothetical protein
MDHNGTWNFSRPFQHLHPVLQAASHLLSLWISKQASFEDKQGDNFIQLTFENLLCVFIVFSIDAEDSFNFILVIGWCSNSFCNAAAVNCRAVRCL